MRIGQASQWANPGLKFLSPAQTRPKPWRARPEPDPKKPRSPQTAQTIPMQGLIQFYLKMLLHLTLVKTSELGCF